MEGSSERPDRADNRLDFSSVTIATPKAYRYPFGSLKYPLQRWGVIEWLGGHLASSQGPSTTVNFGALT
ncbi:hypothetical protein BTVI_42075 [Pitangus sulphuratus]|nr:hypothetical protein BTVI_42075 [Pitangus sulphuratus]